jgi:ABC-type uncharacterized transport system YnjBCD ATPase subunit
METGALSEIQAVSATDARAAPGISLRGLSKHFPGHVAVDGVDVEIGAGELTVLLGPSGCGKSTLLRLIAGFEAPNAGEIVLGEHVLGDLPPARRDIAMVFQNYALFPHLTVADNITFGLSVRRTGKGETAERLDKVARLMGLENLLGRKPAQLSGGQLASDDGTKVHFDSPAVEQAAQFMVDLTTKYKVMEPGTLDWGATPKAFFTGNAAIIWTTTGNLTNITKNALEGIMSGQAQVKPALEEAQKKATAVLAPYQ